MPKFQCPVCKGTSDQPLANGMWCSCVVRRYVKGEGTQSFKVEMDMLDASVRSVPEYEVVGS